MRKYEVSIDVKIKVEGGKTFKLSSKDTVEAIGSFGKKEAIELINLTKLNYTNNSNSSHMFEMIRKSFPGSDLNIVIEVTSIIPLYDKIKGSKDSKIEDKIQKLINLSFSSNEHEAKLAADKATELMEKYSVNSSSSDLIVLVNNTNVVKLEDWMITLYKLMARVSGCYFCWIDGIPGLVNSYNLASYKITGIERDVLNADYLISTIERQVEALTKEWLIGKRKSALSIRSYKYGLVTGVISRLIESREEYFRKVGSKELASIDTRAKDASDFFETMASVKRVKSKSKYNNDKDEGIKHSKKVSIVKAAGTTEKILKIERK